MAPDQREIMKERLGNPLNATLEIGGRGYTIDTVYVVGK